jgi:hypothetical protein
MSKNGIVLLCVSVVFGVAYPAACDAGHMLAMNAETAPREFPKVAWVRGAGVVVDALVVPHPDTADGDKEICAAFSEDGGHVWSAPAPLTPPGPETLGEDMKPSIATNARGLWMVVWQSRAPFGQCSGESWVVLCSSSNDGGRSWSEPVVLSDDERCDQTNPQLHYLERSERWLVTWQSRELTGHSQTAVHCAFSSNDGAAWSVPSVVFEALAEEVTGDEYFEVLVSIAGTIDARLYRRSAATNQLRISHAVSTNNGDDWTVVDAVRGDIVIAGFSDVLDADAESFSAFGGVQHSDDGEMRYVYAGIAAVCFYVAAAGYYGLAYLRRRQAPTPAPVAPHSSHVGAR